MLEWVQVGHLLKLAKGGGWRKLSARSKTDRNDDGWFGWPIRLIIRQANFCTKRVNTAIFSMCSLLWRKDQNEQQDTAASNNNTLEPNSE